MIGSRGTPLILVFFFNWELIEGLKPKVLESAGTKAKQKKAQGPMPKLAESAGTKHTSKLLCFFYGIYMFYCASRVQAVCNLILPLMVGKQLIIAYFSTGLKFAQILEGHFMISFDTVKDI